MYFLQTFQKHMPTMKNDSELSKKDEVHWKDLFGYAGPDTGMQSVREGIGPQSISIMESMRMGRVN